MTEIELAGVVTRLLATFTNAMVVDDTPVPLSVTGEPVTATLALIVRLPFTRPVAVGENTTLIVQVLLAASVVPHVPPAAPAGRE